MPVQLQTFGFTVTLRKLVQRSDGNASTPSPPSSNTSSSSTARLQALKTSLANDTAAQKAAQSAQQSEIDLTHYLSENDTIRTVKSLGQVAGGLTITIADQLSTEIQDTIYALIEPMDMIEIRAARLQQDFVGQKLPLIMRAYVNAVERPEEISGDGTPSRTVVIRGMDSGKLWQINQVLFQYLLASGVPFLDPFRMQAATGIEGGPLPVGQYMQKLVDYMNDKVKQLSAYSHQMITPFALVSTVPDGLAFIQSISGKEGPIWNYVEAFADRPWNEAFLIDEEAAPTVYFRPTPYKDLSGKLIMDGAADPGSVDIDQIEIISLSLGRSDGRVANFFWVPPADGTLESGAYLTAAALANAQQIDANYANNSVILYGERIMQTETHLIPDKAVLPPTLLPPGERAAANGEYISWNILKSAQLKAMNRDNSVFEEGGATVNGKEQLRIGRYARIHRGSVTSECYITQVVHTFSPLRSWTSALTLERGNGFYNRDRASNVPFFAEGRSGPYSK